MNSSDKKGITRRFFINGAVLTVSSLALRSVGIGFNVYLTGRIGEEGMGLFQLALSVYFLAATFATSGISIAMTRVISERVGKDPRRIMRSGMTLSLFLSLIVASALFAFAEPISLGWLQDSRTIPFLQIFAPSLVFVSVAGCVQGYFIAERKIGHATACNVFDQMSKIMLTVLAVSLMKPQRLEDICLIVVAANVTGDALSAAFDIFLYWVTVKKEEGEAVKERYFGKIAAIAIPVAGSAYVRAGLRTAENLLIPWGLGKHGYSRADALSGFGILRSMVMPIIFFPHTVISSFAVLLIPELARLKKQGEKGRIFSIVSRVFRAVLLYAIFCAAAIAAFAGDITAAVYDNESMAGILKSIALLVPVMYLDSATDAMLNALDQQVATLKINTIDSAFRVGLLIFAIPTWGFEGYVAVMFISSGFNAFLSVRQLLMVTGVKIIWIRWMAMPALAAIAAVLGSAIITERLLPFAAFLPAAARLGLNLLISLALFLAAARVFGILPTKRPQKAGNRCAMALKSVK
jgi:stage V sporulation protein B